MRIQRRLKPDSGIDMTPLIDVVYQLVIFFMITSVFKTAPGIALDLPGSTTSSAVSTTALSVTAISEDEIYVDKTRTTLQGLDATVKEAVQGRDLKELKAYFQGEKSSSYQLMEDRDRLVLSKGHAGPALYSALALKGFFPLEWLHTLNKGGTRLPSHCDRNRTPGIDMTTGSLGQGISAACGIALANRIDKRDVYTYAIIGDGESDEGEVWEAAMFAGHYGLSHLIAFTDNNKMQIDGTTAEVMSVDGKAGADGSRDPRRLDAKWTAFGWAAERVAGHDVGAICDAIEAAKARAEKGDERPTMIVLDTVKGKGAAFCEGQVGSHNMLFSPK